MKHFLMIVAVIVVVSAFVWFLQKPKERIAGITTHADATRVVFNSNRDGGRMDIWLMNEDGSDLVQLTKNQGNNYGPQWNGDKSKIIFVSDRDGGNNELYIMNADGTHEQRLTETSAEELWPSVSVDTKYAVFARGPRGGKHDIWRQDLITGEEMNITSTPDADELEAFFNASMTRIVYTSDRVTTGIYNCFDATLDGLDVAQLTHSLTTQDHCMYNSDGSRISFARENAQNKKEWQIWTMAADGSDEQLLVGQKDILNDCAEWSHDNSAIVIESTTDFENNGDVYRYDLATKQLVNLTPGTPDSVELHPVW